MGLLNGWDRSALAVAVAAMAFLGSSGPALAEDGADDAAQANNPLANMTAFNLQNYYIGRVTETDEDANQF